MDTFDEDAAIAIVQARHEALLRRAPEILPSHLILGVINTLPAGLRTRWAGDEARLEQLRLDLGGPRSPAPPIPQDIGYGPLATLVLETAITLAAGQPVSPRQVLLAIHAAPVGEADIAPAREALARAGLGMEHLLDERRTDEG